MLAKPGVAKNLQFVVTGKPVKVHILNILYIDNGNWQILRDIMTFTQ